MVPVLWAAALALASCGGDSAASPSLVSISVTTPPTKTVYVVGEPFSAAGLAVTATYDDASAKAVTDYTLTWGGVTLAEGNIAVTAAAGRDKPVTVTYKDKTASFTITVNTPDTADKTAPAKVSGLTGTAGDGQVVLTWTDPGDPDLASIEITFSPEKAGITQPVSVAKAALRKVIEGLDNGTAYTFTVTAVDTSGNKSAGETTGPFTPADTTPPGKVTSLIAIPGNGKVRLIWTDPADVDLATIEITFSSGKTGVTQPVSVAKAVRLAVIDGLDNNTDYTFTVKAKDTTGNLSAGETATAKPEGTLNSDLTPPAKVDGLAVDAAATTATSVTLTWTDPADPDLVSIEITWEPNSGSTTATKSTAPDRANSATVTGLTKGTEYTFTVKAKDNAAPTANESFAATIQATPREPTAQVRVTFTGPADETITLTGAEGTLSQAANTPITVTVTGAYDAYRWALDGNELWGETGSSLTRSAGSLEVKRHTLTVFVTKGGVEYAKRVTFTVTN